jgi:hypothetical protein
MHLPAILVHATSLVLIVAASLSVRAADPLPEIGAEMPDGTVYAGLSMDTGKPLFVPAPGRRMPDGTVYAGISPDSDKALYTTPQDAPVVFPWLRAQRYCVALSASHRRDWHVPTLGELAVLFINRASIGSFNETGYVNNGPGYYWSSVQVGDASAWAQRFNDGYHEDLNKAQDSLVRCVRSS